MQVHPGRALGQLEQEYLELGLRYFVLARHAAFCLYAQAAAYTCHVTFEMLFEAELIRTGADRAKLSHYHHDLDRIWKDFKLSTGWEPGTKWDRLVTHLDEWRNVRFPTGEPRSMGLGVTGWATSSTQAIDRQTGEPIGRPSVNHPRYQLKLWKVDEFFKMVVTRLSLDDAWLRDSMREGVETYLRDNHHPLF
jgi:hypothetical protein